MTNVSGRSLSALSLFTSLGTLVCCALPTLLVFLGFGATVASIVSAVPFLASLSQHKAWVFASAGIFIAAGYAYRRSVAPRLLARQLACDPDDPRCHLFDRASGVLLWISVGLLCVGAAVAYGLPLLFRLLDA